MIASQADVFAGIEAVFFDLFDTLVRVDGSRLPSVEWKGQHVPSTAPVLFSEAKDLLGDLSFDQYLAGAIEVSREIGAEKTASTVEISTNQRMTRILERVAPDVDDAIRNARAEILAERHMRMLADSLVAVEGARDLLEAVRERGLRVALISNFECTEAVPWILEGTDLEGTLEELIVSEDLGICKPDERIFQTALRSLDTQAENALHVGDSARADIWGGGRAGMRTAWINPKDAPFPFEDHLPSLTVRRLAALRAWLSGA